MPPEAKYELEHDPAQNLIRARVVGEIDPALVERMAREVAELARRHGCARLLSDLRGATLTPATLDIYAMPRIADESGVPPGFRRALLVAATSRDFVFIETVAVNRGHSLRLFTDPAAALAWLA